MSHFMRCRAKNQMFNLLFEGCVVFNRAVDDLFLFLHLIGCGYVTCRCGQIKQLKWAGIQQ